MPCPHYEITIVKRTAGESAVAAAAYQSRSNLFNEYRQQTERFANYKNKGEGLLWEEVLLPANAPGEYADRSVLWNSVERAEDQRNSQLARRIKLTLPNEIPREMWKPMLREYVQEQFVSRGMCADIAIHFNEPPPNPHAHILLTLRSIDEKGKWMPKFVKVPIDDGHGNPVCDASGKRKTHPVNINDWNNKENAEIWRSSWAEKQNEYLEKIGSDVRVDLRSYKRQGKMQIPTVHLGPSAHALMKRGEYSYLNRLNGDISETNSFLTKLGEIAERISGFFAGWLERKMEAIDEKEMRERPPVLSDLYGWWLIRHEQRSTWKSGQAQSKCGIRDWNEMQELIAYLRTNRLYTREAVLTRLEETESRAGELRSSMKNGKARIKTVEAILTAAETVNRLQPIHNKASFGFGAKRFSEEHAAEVAEYKAAYAVLMRLNHQSVKIDRTQLLDERDGLADQLQKLEKKLDALKPQLEPLRKIRKCMAAVEADLARSERKPSLREELKQIESERKHSHRMEPVDRNREAI